MKKSLIDFTIGADPEFACLTSRNKVITSTDYVDRGDDVEFGSDGNGRTFELRPAPSKNPIQIVNNIHEIFLRQVAERPEFLKFKWVSASYYKGYPFGGHVHFGLKQTQIDTSTAIRCLDDHVGNLSLLLEIRDGGISRRKHGYGRMSDMRHQPWGFEYRPMSSWLSSPYAAAAILCLSKTVVFELLNNPKFKWARISEPSDFSNVDQTRILTQFPEIWDNITKMRLYELYKPYIDVIHFLVSNNLTWQSTCDMKESWGIRNINSYENNKIPINSIWNLYNTEQTENL